MENKLIYLKVVVSNGRILVIHEKDFFIKNFKIGDKIIKANIFENNRNLKISNLDKPIGTTGWNPDLNLFNVEIFSLTKSVDELIYICTKHIVNGIKAQLEKIDKSKIALEKILDSSGIEFKERDCCI